MQMENESLFLGVFFFFFTLLDSIEESGQEAKWVRIRKDLYWL